MDVQGEPPFDPVEEASQESFPASDAPAWTITGTRDGALVGEHCDVEVVNNETTHHFEMQFAEGLASLRYRYDPDGSLVLLHTEVPRALESRALAGQLAKTALEFAKNHGLHVVVICPFVAAFIRKHPEFRALVRAN